MAMISLIMQPSWQNYMDDLATAFARREGPEALESWRQLDFSQRVDYFLKRNAIPSDSLWLKEAISQSKCMAQKNDDTAEKFRQDGNKKFQRKWYQQAMDDYTQCIRYSSLEKVNLGYSNRSAALYYLELFEHCILDVDKALQHDLPVKLHYKVYNRRAMSYRELGFHGKAKTDFEMALECLQKAELDESRLEKLKTEIESDISALKPGDSSIPELDVYPKSTVPEVVGGKSSHVTQASKYVKIKYSPETGRYLVAGCDVNAGDALISESPYAAVLLPEFYSSHCHHCFVRTTAPIPCLKCPIVLYCTPECRDLAWKKYHHIECPYLPLMHAIGIAHLALRIIVVSGLRFLEEFRSDDKNLSFDSSARYEFGYRTVYHLLHHTERMQTEDLIQYAICAVLLLQCLEDANFFQDKKILEKNPEISTDDIAETEVFIGGLLLRHIQQLVCNAHAVSDWSTSGGDPRNEMVRDINDARIATAIYPTASLMNHSCDPNILSNFHSETLVVRCTKPIKKGEEIFNCYGPHCKRMERYDRQKALEMQYFFTCNCSACSDISTTVERHKALKCPSCNGPLPRPKLGAVEFSVPCSDCGKIYTMEDLNNVLPLVFQSQRTMVEGMQASDNGDMEGAKDLFRQCLKQQKQVLYKEHEDMAATCDQLARIFTLEENYKKAEPYVDFSVKVIGRIHGYQSVEYGTELKKLAQIQFNGLMVEKCRKNVERAMNVLTANLGEGNEQVQELVKMMRCLNGAKY